MPPRSATFTWALTAVPGYAARPPPTVSLVPRLLATVATSRAYRRGEGIADAADRTSYSAHAGLHRD